MPKSAQTGDFFVVGGPVQSDRSCYVKRDADDRLVQALADERFAFVLSPRATGKSSLMAGTIRRLRSEGQLAAVVDLTQIGSRTEGTDAGRWYYSIAYRIVRELRLKVDLQDWWQDRSALLSEQRLVEFFGDIVLANTTAPVNVFVDEADRAIELPFAAELFIALRSCYMRRVSEPDFARLNFVVLGVATPELLCPDASLSPFTDGVGIELTDFTVDESMQLAAGFNCDESTAADIVTAIYRWTGGHPYLTQKVARAVARRSGTAEDVDPMVRELLLAPAKLHEEPLLNQMCIQLEGNDKVARQALGVLGRLANGAAMAGETGAAGRALLDRIGMLRRRADGTLGYRNLVFRSVFDTSFSKASVPIDWRRPAAIAAIVLLVIGLPYWYFGVLPQPYIATLTVVSQDVALAEEAHRRLQRLPGFGGRADRLLVEAMVRRSNQASSMEDVLAADRVLRRLPEQTGLADRMLADFWLRSAATSMHAGDRDAALIYAIVAGQGEPEAARTLAAELIADDYPYLEASFRTTGAGLGWEIDWARDRLVLIDESRRIRHLALGTQLDGARPGPQNPLPGRLTAVQHVEVQRELTVDADGRAGAFTLLLTTQHARASDLRVRLTAPSGASAEFPVPQPRADQQSLIFSARGNSPLTQLSAETVRGQWRLTLVDRRSGELGTLTTWGLQFPGSPAEWEDAPEQGIPLPDPVRTEQVETILAPGGGAVVAIPSRTGVSGALSVWDLVAGELRADIEIETVPGFVNLLDDGARLIAVSDSTARLWDVDRSRLLAEIQATNGFVAVPAISSDQRFVALAQAVDEVTNSVTLLETGTGTVVGEYVIRRPIVEWALAAGGRYLAILDESRWLRLFDAATGAELGEVMHQRRLSRLAPMTRAEMVVAIDDENAVVAWPLDAQTDGLVIGEAQFLGITADPATVAVADRSRRVVFSASGNRVDVREVTAGRVRGADLRVKGARRVRISPAGDDIVIEGERLLRRWHLGAAALNGIPELGLSAAALDPTAQVAALGYRAGDLRIMAVADLLSAGGNDGRVDYIGHRGAITSVDIAPAFGVAVSGGADGVVRIWDLATVAPNEYFLRHPEGPVRAVAISPDGRWIASAAEYSARIWQVQSGELLAEVPVDGSALAVAFAPSSALVAVGDSAGNLFLGSPRGADTLRSAHMNAPVSAISFSRDSTLLASGDQAGNLILWDVSATEVALARASFPEPVRWIGFPRDGGGLLAATDEWLHALQRDGERLTIVATRMLASGAVGASDFVSTGPRAVRLIAASAAGGPASQAFDLEPGAARPGGPMPDALPERDWAGILGLELDGATGIVRPVMK